MPNEFGFFRGRELMQKRGSVGGFRNVFVKLQGIKNELVYPTFGGLIRNPFKTATGTNPAKMFAGDLCWYKTNDKGMEPEIYLLKTFEVISASSTTVNINKDGGFRHKPCVGDIIMKAPETIGGEGTGVKITAIEETTVTVSEVVYNVWAVTTSANIASSLSKGDIMVEAEATGSTTMLVKAINAIIDCDCDFFDTPVITPNTNLTPTSATNTSDFDSPRFMYTPALGGIMYTHKMSPVPACVKLLNRSNINGWFRVDWYDMNGSVSAAETATAEKLAVLFQEGTTDPTTSTVGVIGSTYTNTTDQGMFRCTNVTVGAESTTYTWEEITFVS